MPDPAVPSPDLLDLRALPAIAGPATADDQHQALLRQHGLTPSMSRAGDCYDKALAESFVATLKTELIDRQPWPTRRAARVAIFDWIEGFYNPTRLHSALGYHSPVAFEEGLTTMRLVA